MATQFHPPSRVVRTDAGCSPPVRSFGSALRASSPGYVGSVTVTCGGAPRSASVYRGAHQPIVAGRDTRGFSSSPPNPGQYVQDANHCSWVGGGSVSPPVPCQVAKARVGRATVTFPNIMRLVSPAMRHISGSISPPVGPPSFAWGQQQMQGPSVSRDRDSLGSAVHQRPNHSMPENSGSCCFATVPPPNPAACKTDSRPEVPIHPAMTAGNAGGTSVTMSHRPPAGGMLPPQLKGQALQPPMCTSNGVYQSF